MLMAMKWCGSSLDNIILPTVDLGQRATHRVIIDT